MHKCENETDKICASPDGKSAISSRRKLLVGAISVPVVLAVSGRSALACSSDGSGCNHKGLSLAAWCSVHPGHGKKVTHSHTIDTGNACGKPPSHWKPKCDNNHDYTFNDHWPVRPCDKRNGLKGADGKYYHYSSTYRKAKGVRSDDMGWDGGHKFDGGWGSCSGRSVSRVLISGNTKEQHICAAYLNIKKFGGLYPVRASELQQLANNKFGTRNLTDTEICDYIMQTCA